MKKLHNLLCLLILCLPLLLVSACKKSLYETPQPTLGDVPEEIVLCFIYDVTADSAVVKADNRFNKATEMGFCWSETSDNSTINDLKTTLQPNKKVFIEMLKCLESETTYTVRAYVIQKDKLYYSNMMVFKTLKKNIGIQPGR